MGQMMSDSKTSTNKEGTHQTLTAKVSKQFESPNFSQGNLVINSLGSL